MWIFNIKAVINQTFLVNYIHIWTMVWYNSNIRI